MKKEDIAAEVLSALKAADILERIERFLARSGENVSKEKLLAIIHKEEDADGCYTQPDD